jgi:hypothetical protein
LRCGGGLVQVTAAAAGDAAHLLLCSSLIQHPLLLSFLQSSSKSTTSLNDTFLKQERPIIEEVHSKSRSKHTKPNFRKVAAPHLHALHKQLDM